MSDSKDPLARLTVKRSGVLTSEIFEFRPPAVIGRFDPSVGPIDVDLGHLPEGAYVSRRHARIIWASGEWRIEDLGSSNGTYILREEFERVDESPLESGAEIALGNARFVFEVVSQEGPVSENGERPSTEPEASDAECG